MAQMKVCSSCGKRRREGRFDADSSRPDGKYAQCKTCKHTPKRRKQINAVRGAAHQASLKEARRKGRQWTATEDKAVLEMSFKDAAAKTGRTYWAVAQRRWRLRNPNKKK